MEISVRHGYSIKEIDSLARKATYRVATHYRGGSRADMFEAAWYGVAEALTIAESRPSEDELVKAGMEAADQDAYSTRRQRGITASGERGPNFERYWSGPDTSSPEGAVVERITVAQILPSLPTTERRYLDALAVAGTPRAAAQMLGVSEGAFSSQVSKARRAFLTLWHEGEEPSKLWRYSKPNYPVRPRTTAGTFAQEAA